MPKINLYDSVVTCSFFKAVFNVTPYVLRLIMHAVQFRFFYRFDVSTATSRQSTATSPLIDRSLITIDRNRTVRLLLGSIVHTYE